MFRYGKLRRLLALAVLTGTASAAVLVAGPVPPAAAATLGNPVWTVSNSATGATGVSYTYAFTTVTPATLIAIKVSVPAGTSAGALTVSSVRPAAIAGGTASLSGTTITYSFAAASFIANTAVQLTVSGLTNTATAGSYFSGMATTTASGSLDTAASSPQVQLTAATVTSVGWTASSTAVGATGVTYTWTFTLASAAIITSYTLTVPYGTAGSPTVVTLSPGGLLGASAALSGNVVTVSGISLSLGAGTAVTIAIGGLTSTTVAGSYTSEIGVNTLLSGTVNTGITPALAFTGPLSLTSPTALTWAATLTGNNFNLADLTAAHQQLSVDDETSTAAGWHVTTAATTFTSGTFTLPAAGTFVVTGSLTSISATSAPTVTCVLSCDPPVPAATYPVAITTAASSPAPATIYSAAAGTGLGPAIIGGSTAASPLGWWVVIPASARAGAYTSTITMNIVSGP